MTAADARPALEIVGVALPALSIRTAADDVISAIKSDERGHVCVANVDMITRALRMPELRAAMHDARLVVADGMPLVWLQCWLGLHAAERVYGPAFMDELCRRAEEEQIPIFLFGGTHEVLGRLVSSLMVKYKELRIAGSLAPPLLPTNPPVDFALIDDMRKSGARLIFVALGCPKQELWMYSHSKHLHATIIGVGMAFAQLAGAMPRAPSWMQQLGLEWMYRLYHEPRLWKRYLIGNSIFIVMASSILLRACVKQFWRSARN